jgi:heme A synthase
MTAKRFVGWAGGVLLLNLLVIVWGAYVRASGSGAGCGAHWPLCNGEILPRAAAVTTRIEFFHRVTSALALISVVALVLAAWRSFARGSLVRRMAVASLVFMLLEAALGAGLVLFRLVEDNASVARAVAMGAHLANTFLLLACLSWTLGAARGGWESPRRKAPRSSWLLAALAGLLVVGISGAVAALGDTLYPPTSLRGAVEQELSPTGEALVRLRVAHPFLAVIVGGALLLWVRSVAERSNSPRVRQRAATVAGLVMLQIVGGIVDVVLLAPIPVQLAHLLLADLLWVATALLVGELRWQPEVVSTPSAVPPTPA